MSAIEFNKQGTVQLSSICIVLGVFVCCKTTGQSTNAIKSVWLGDKDKIMQRYPYKGCLSPVGFG